MALSSDLPTLETLHGTLKTDVDNAHSIISDTDSSVVNAVWESPNAEEFRAAWDDFRPKLVNFEQALALAACDVANNHNNIAQANGVDDAPSWSRSSPTTDGLGGLRNGCGTRVGVAAPVLRQAPPVFPDLHCVLGCPKRGFTRLWERPGSDSCGNGCVAIY